MSLRTPHFGPHAGRLCRVTADGLVPLGEPAGTWVPPLVLPDRVSTGTGWEAGEIDGPDTRGNRRALEESIVSHHGEQHRDWARAKAARAVDNWDRGVRTGRVQRPSGG